MFYINYLGCSYYNWGIYYDDIADVDDGAPLDVEGGMRACGDDPRPVIAVFFFIR